MTGQSLPLDQPAEHSTPTEDTAAPALPRSWAELFPPRPAPAGVPYGFLSARGEPVPSSRETLLHLARTQALPSLVWTPGSEQMVPPWEVPFLLEAMRQSPAASARRELRTVYAALAVFALLDLLLFLVAPLVAVLLMVVIGGLLGLLALSVHRRATAAEQLDSEAVRRDFDALVEQHYEALQPIPATRSIMGCIAAVGVCQILFLDASVEAGAVSREAVLAGHWWRLLTAPMLHGGVMHFWMNFGALESLGRTMETRGVRSYVPLVFLVAAIAGGFSSIALPPHGDSVGASGGLMGMFGFLAVMAYRRRQRMPEGSLRALLINIAFIGLVGLVAYRFIDNAAHAGGLVAGLLIGIAAVPRDEEEWRESIALRWAARAAQGVIVTCAAMAILATLIRAFG
ncbi:MAG TPA: rhomboid family intramembrane serine protease [Longimicrobium sp.]|nr:rhomboid family intramembrane serine protease [Longimicrobium sp.]